VAFTPKLRVKPDALITLPSRRFSVTTANPRRATVVDAITLSGARMVGAAILATEPHRVLVVEVSDLHGKRVA
jgi:hypothetical protein